MMKRVVCLFFLFISWLGTVEAQVSFDSICHILKEAPVQEKVYLHLDNNCYYKGDTIWYKAYVVKAGDLTYTDMSRILYVELVNPDGLLVERQALVVSPDGYSCGNFELKDSFYSGFFEVRAYTRWMLNFDVTHHPYWTKDKQMFYSLDMADDFFRQYGTIYSRVFPVYERPDTPGNYSDKVFVSRPKSNLNRELDEKLTVNFYPEGGSMVAGTRCRVAFEAFNEHGQQVELQGTIGKQDVKTIHEGRGCADIDVPMSGHLRATFNYNGKKKHFDLPDITDKGCALHLTRTGDDMKALVQLRGLPTDRQYMAFILCRGMLQQAWPLTPDAQGQTTLTWKSADLPTGVNDLIILDDRCTPLADRLFFVNNHDYSQGGIEVDDTPVDYQPHQLIALDFQAPADAKHISISVRDGQSDDPTFDTGNILTDLLLSSELRGFIPYPDYYFESDDETHLQALDNLMLVQGWRRYDINDLLSTDTLRYTPEKNLTVEGRVFNTIIMETRDYSADEMWGQDFYDYNETQSEGYRDDLTSSNISNSIIPSKSEETQKSQEQLPTPQRAQNEDSYAMNYNRLKHEVTVESELILGSKVYAIEMETHDGGHFSFNMPAFYDRGILTMAAHDTDISKKKEMRLKLKGRMDEQLPPEYYVKRDLFYPIFAKKYSYYQCHYPMETLQLDENDNGVYDTLRISKMDKTLSGIVVKGKRRRGLRSIDYTRPLCTYDAVDLYNLATDYGLSYGMFASELFPSQVSMLLLGNFNSPISPQISTQINYFMTYLESINKHNTKEVRDSIEILKIRGYDSQLGHEELRLRRLNKINLFSDFELRNEDQPMVGAQDRSIFGFSDVIIDYVTMLDDTTRPTFRDRWIIIPGIYEPDEFYHPDYTLAPPPPEKMDYRRTLYWNPNAQLDEDGCYKVRFYNNSKTTRVKVSAMGITADGKPISNY